MMNMAKKSSMRDHEDASVQRSVGWKLLRVALLWARKGGVYRRRLMMELQVIPKFLKSLAANATAHTHHQHHHHRNASIQYYFERQLSFDKTPLFPSLKSRSSSMRFNLNIPCLNPPLVLDFEQYDPDHDIEKLSVAAAAAAAAAASPYNGITDCDEDESVDTKADEFIAKFYRQMKLQRQISYLQSSASAQH